MQPQQIFKISFPTIFPPLQQGSAFAPSSFSVLQSIKQYLSQCNEQISAIKDIKHQAYKLKSTLKIPKQKLNIFKITQCGCIIVLEKPQQQQFTRVYLVYGNDWKIDWSITQNQKNGNIYQIPQDKFQIVYIGQICNSQDFYQNYQDFSQIYKRIGKNVNLHNVVNFPSQIMYLCRNVIQLIINKQNSAATSKIYQNLNIYSNNSTFSTSKTNQSVRKPNTAWTIDWSYIFFLSKNQELIKMLILDFRIWILRKYVIQQLDKAQIQAQLQQKQQKFLQQKSSLVLFTKCLQYLRSQSQLLNSTSNYYYNHQKLPQILTKLSQKIQLINIPCRQITYKQQDIGKHHPIQQFNLNMYNLMPAMSQTTQKNVQNMKNLSSTLRISQQYPIQDLLDKCQKIDEELWILAVQDTIFTIAYNQLSRDSQLILQKYSLSLVKINLSTNYHKTQSIFMKLFAKYVQKIQKSKSKYPISLQYQANSHVQLVKALLSVFSFQIYKRQKKGTIFDISQYRVPLNIHLLYTNFNSISHKARKAMQILYKYCLKNKAKKLFFDQFKGYQCYKQYVARVVTQSKYIKDQYNKKINNLKIAKNTLKQKFIQFYKILAELQNKLEYFKGQPNQCRQQKYQQIQQDYSTSKRKTVWKTRFIQCQRCKKIKIYENSIYKHQMKRQYQIKTAIPKNDGYIHQFFYTLDPDMQGLISMVLLSQHMKVGTYMRNTHNLDIFSRGALSIVSDYGNPVQFRFIDYKESDVDKLVSYANDKIILYWNGYSDPTIDYSYMNRDSTNIYSQQYRNHIDFLQNPSSPPSNIAQHNVYAKLSQKPVTIKTDEYITIGSCRVGKYTQIAMCLEGLLNRTICIDTFSKDYQYKMYIVHRCLSSLSAAKPQQLSDEANRNIWDGTKYFFTYFLDNYERQWSSRDFQALPVIGPLLSMMSRTLTDPRKYIQQYSFLYIKTNIDTSAITSKQAIRYIMKKTIAQYQRIQQDIRNSAGKSAQSLNLQNQNQYFICFASICCFTQHLLNITQALAYYFVRLIVIMRFKEVYLTSSSKQSNFAKVVKKYQYLKTRAIQSNIQTALQIFTQKPHKLTQVVKVVDTIDQSTTWSKDKDGQFLFQGIDKWGNTYKIDIKHGKVTKNDQSISRVPQAYKQLQEYKTIFQNRDFQVFPSQNKNSLITKRSFTDLFLGNIDVQDVAHFEFAYSNDKKPIINLIFRYNQTSTQQSWRLLSTKQLLKFIPLPKFYQQNFYGWHSHKRNCIVFRQPNFARIGQVALVAFLDQKLIGQQKGLSFINVISRQHFRASLDLLCDKKKKIFQKLILRKNKDSTPYKILQRIQKVQYILQLQSYQNNQRKFWLHRYDSMFLQDQKHGLIPQSFKNYRVSQNPYSNKLIPWDQKDKIRCLVIQKFVFAETTQQMHKTKIIIPEWKCDENGRVQIKDPKNVNQTASFYVYDIHDHFGDIRGGNRMSQLHIVSILAAINKNIRNPHTKLTSIQYAIKILKSCFNNCPLTDTQILQLKNIMAIASCQQNQSLLLMCYALFKCTIEIDCLKKQADNFQVDHVFENGDSLRNVMANAVNRYMKMVCNSSLPIRQKIPNYIQNILGIKNNYNRSSRGRYRAWRKQYKLLYKLPQKATQSYLSKYQKILQQWTKLNTEIIQNTDIQKIQQYQKQIKQFPLNIQNPQQNPLLQQVIGQLKQSYKMHNLSKINLKSIKIDKFQIFKKFTQINNRLKQCKMEIGKIVNGVILQNSRHVDICTGHAPVLSTFDYVNLMIQNLNVNKNIKNSESQYMFDQLFPDFQSTQQKAQFKNNLLTLIKYWLLFSVKIDSCQRILIIIQRQIQNKDQQIDIDIQTDKVALFRQLQSPRQQIQKRIHWICFEAEMKIQIWKSQFETFKNLFVMNKSGSVSQLNMGQGKTQIIIPMITLQLLYGDKLQEYLMFKPQKKQQEKHKQLSSVCKIPRVNLMQALLNQSKLNYFRFLSVTAFNIPITILPFDRQVNFSKNQKSIVRSLGYFKNKMLILVDQSSIHSLMLKLREQTMKSSQKRVYNKQDTIFYGIDVFDVFDEVDAQLSPKKSFIYSVGGWTPLDSLDFRISIAADMLQNLCLIVQKLYKQKLIALDDTLQNILISLKRGQFPKGLRLISNILTNQQSKQKFRKYLISNFLQNINNDQCKFLQILQKHQLQNVIKYVIQQNQQQRILSNKITPAAKNVLYLLRGFFAYGVFQHCISLRCKVSYGIPDQQRKQKTKKRLAVPYQAADIPSKKNDYAHPDVAIILSYLSYYNFGLNEQQVLQCISRLLTLTANNQQARNSIYKQWHQCLSKQQQQQLKITNTLQIQLHSQAQRKRLYTAFKMNRKFIAYWLRNCVFIKNMAQYNNSITSSSWDQADVRHCIGFSGTKDNCRLLPSYVTLVQSDNKEIIGTDGKMIDMLIQHTHQVIDIVQNQQSPWQRFLNTIFQLKKQYNVASIIDAGAVLASKSLKDDIIPWIAKHKKFNTHNKFKGISFCVDNMWKVFKLSNEEFIDRFTSIPDHQTFVIFDQYRTRGADVKMDANITAVLSISSDMTKDSLMQAVGRLRKIGRNQKVVILITQQIKLKMRKQVTYKDSMTTKQKIKAIISWSSLNSIKQNQKYLLPNVKLSKIHFLNCIRPQQPYIDISDTSLKNLYSPPITYKPIAQLCQKKILQLSQSLHLLPQKQTQSITKLRIVFNLYGKIKQAKQQNFDQVCQRQTQKSTEIQQQVQKAKYSLTGFRQSQDIVEVKLNQVYKFKFSEQVFTTQNFHQCTKSQDKINQLMTCYFILVDMNHICMVTQRQVHKLLTQQNLPIYMTDYKQDYKKYIARLSDLTVRNQLIKQYRLQQAYVHCKFYNGETKFQDRMQNSILKNLLRTQKQREVKIKYFLQRRKQMQKYKNTSLEKIYKQLELMPQNFSQISTFNAFYQLDNQDINFKEQVQEDENVNGKKLQKEDQKKKVDKKQQAQVQQDQDDQNNQEDDKEGDEEDEAQEGQKLDADQEDQEQEQQEQQQDDEDDQDDDEEDEDQGQQDEQQQQNEEDQNEAEANNQQQDDSDDQSQVQPYKPKQPQTSKKP